MYGNAATLPTTLGGGEHVHVGLIMKATLCVTLSPMAHAAPAEPPLTPDIPTNNNKCGTSTTPWSTNGRTANLQKPHQHWWCTQDPTYRCSWISVCERITKSVHRVYGGNDTPPTRSSDISVRQYHGCRYQIQWSTHQLIIWSFTSYQHLFPTYWWCCTVCQWRKNPFTEKQILQTAFHSGNVTRPRGMQGMATKRRRRQRMDKFQTSLFCWVSQDKWTTFRIGWGSIQ